MTELDIRRAPEGVKATKTMSLAIFVLVLAAVFPFMHPRGEQQLSRYALTAAVWDLGTFEVTEYADLLKRDGSVRGGVVYSDKAPGQPLLGVPFYGVYRLVGGDPYGETTPDPDWGEWWVRLWTAGIPAALLAVLMFRWAGEIEPQTALVATLTMALGSLLLVYGTLLFAHVLAALLGFAMFLLVRDRRTSPGGLALAGALGGVAVLVEYPLALVVAIMVGTAFFVHRTRAWPVFAGGVPALIALGLYNWQLFGSPIVFSYQWNVFHGIRNEAADTLEIFAGPSWDRFVDVLISPRGLLVATPVVILAIVGFGLMWKRGWRVDVVVPLLAFLSMLAIQASWENSFAGGAGPRYVTPGLPFLAAPLAVAWKRWRVICSALALVGVVTLFLATVTTPQLNSGFTAGLGYWVGEVLDGRAAPQAYTQWLGPWGWLVYLGSLIACGAWVFAENAKWQRSTLVATQG